jgi:hypothetical protein
MTASSAAACLAVSARMVREVRPVRDAQGQFWMSRELTGDTFMWCRTHDLDWYGPHAEVMAAFAAHERGHSE